MPKVSVIVPIYNVSQYIERCARSLFEQTLDDLEIIFIDDCTPDNSIEIIKDILLEYPNRTSRSTFIKMPHNSGIASVRKQGIIESTGEYIIHCDGDDWVDKDLYEKLYNKAVAKQADIVICDEIYEYENDSVIEKGIVYYDSGHEIIKNWYHHTFGMFTHDKLVKRSLCIDNNIFPWDGLNMWDDNGFMTRIMYYAKKVVMLNDGYYHYNKANTSSLTKTYSDEHVNQMIDIAENLSLFFDSIPDKEDFQKTKQAFQFLSKLNLITTRYTNILRYNKIFPGSEKIAKHIPLTAFSTKGKIRFLFVKYHLKWIFVTLFKVANFFTKTIK